MIRNRAVIGQKLSAHELNSHASLVALVNPRLLNRLENSFVARMARLLGESRQRADQRSKARKCDQPRIDLGMRIDQSFGNFLYIEPVHRAPALSAGSPSQRCGSTMERE